MLYELTLTQNSYGQALSIWVIIVKSFKLSNYKDYLLPNSLPATKVNHKRTQPTNKKV